MYICPDPCIYVRIVSACHVHVSHFWLSAGFAVKFVKLPIRKADLTIQDGRGYSPLHNATRPGTVQRSSTLNGLNGSTPVLSSAARPDAPPPAPALPGRWRNLDVVQFLLANGATAGEMPLVVKNGVHNEVA